MFEPISKFFQNWYWRWKCKKLIERGLSLVEVAALLRKEGLQNADIYHYLRKTGVPYEEAKLAIHFTPELQQKLEASDKFIKEIDRVTKPGSIKSNSAPRSF